MTPISSCFLTAARRPQKLDNDTLKACRRRRRGLFLTAEPRTSTERAIMASLAVTSSELDKTACDGCVVLGGGGEKKINGSGQSILRAHEDIAQREA